MPPLNTQIGSLFTKLIDAKWQIGEELGFTPQPILPSGDWTPYQFIFEPQSKPGLFDTYSCITEATYHVIECRLNAMRKLGLISDNLWKLYGDLGYLDTNNELHFSVRFGSTMNGTTTEGNDVSTVANDIISQGLIPDKEFPFGGNSFAEYHDMSAITPNMKAKAKLSKALFSFDYRGNVFMTPNGTMTANNIEEAQNALQIAPLMLGIPYPATHGVEGYKLLPGGKFAYVDTYSPYEKVENTPLNWGFQIVATPLDFKLPVCQFATNLSQGMTSQDVTNLQTILNAFGLLTVSPTGYFGQLTFNAVKQFQLAMKIPETGFCGPITRACLNTICV